MYYPTSYIASVRITTDPMTPYLHTTYMPSVIRQFVPLAHTLSGVLLSVLKDQLANNLDKTNSEVYIIDTVLINGACRINRASNSSV